MQSFNMINVAHTLLLDKVQQAQIMLDATCGNGFDTLFLSKNSLSQAEIYAFDIQPEAIANSKKLLKEQGVEHKVSWFCDNHINFSDYIKNKLDVVILNLGYLPNGDKNITTTAPTTILLLEKLLIKLNVGGIVAITSYPGHNEGFAENLILQDQLQTLPSKYFTVASFKMINHSDKAPVFYIIEKVRG